jgi:hypothetical protein
MLNICITSCKIINNKFAINNYYRKEDKIIFKHKKLLLRNIRETLGFLVNRKEAHNALFRLY